MKPIHLLLPAVAAAAVLGFFLHEPEAAAPEPTAQAERASEPEVAFEPELGQQLPPGHPPVGEPPAPMAPAAASLSGEVLESIDVQEYTYLRLKTADGEIWAAVTKTPLAVGQKVELVRPSLMLDFESKSLGRKFERIYFASLAPAAENPGGNMELRAGAGVGVAPGPAPSGIVKLAKATGAGAATIAEIAAAPATFAGKTVRIHAQVTKLTTGIRGKSFLHIQDGTLHQGKPADLAVTTLAEPAPGTRLTVQGTLKTQVDMGFGYQYPLLLEDAVVLPEAPAE